MYDVAQAAGDSPSTVSRVFSRPGRVGAETAARVHASPAQDTGPGRVGSPVGGRVAGSVRASGRRPGRRWAARSGSRISTATLVKCSKTSRSTTTSPAALNALTKWASPSLTAGSSSAGSMR
ncbi:LacI family DNA-binding transcriptional regulator [Streptacidiphilus carbonis]|uniref:LacI family DNA-binding transcriptional regulator n=1 Tax=Streptacidiphilus carbonis TaxID=105422 RepID=UPI000A064C74|nr:LacI family DNA-binding transcriptional regulator [Streptacidiphilus carbonis]